MRYGKLFLALLTALLVLLAAGVATREYAWDGEADISAQIATDRGRETITGWTSADGVTYLFLPAYAEPSQITLHSGIYGEVTLNGVPLQDVTGPSLDTPHTLTCRSGGEEKEFPLILTRSTNMPALYVDTASGSMDHIHQGKENTEGGTFRLYTAQGALTQSGILESVAGRGNSTWASRKKPYNLTLQTAADLLGMGAAKKWVLLSNPLDDTHLRNKIVYDFARELGLRYSPDSRWVELYINGEYAGLYLLSERNEVHPERVDLPSTNSFLVGKEWEWRMDAQGDPYVTTQSGAAFRLRGSAVGANQVLEVLQAAENAILSPDGTDSGTGMHWRELIDVESWVKKYLVEEVFGNTDGGTLSQYFYYDGSRLYAGPVWDYDLSMGNSVAIQPEYPNQLFASRPDIWGSTWYYSLCQNEEFQAELCRVYETEFLPALRELTETGIGEYEAAIASAAVRNQIRWNTEPFQQEIEILKDYVNRRADFLSRLWLEEEEFVLLIANGYDGAKNCYYLTPGQLPPDLLTYDYLTDVKFGGWYYEGTDIPFDPNVPITEPTEIRLRYQILPPPVPEEELEAPSPLRYAPVMLFLGVLVLVALAEVRRNARKKPREPAPR